MTIYEPACSIPVIDEFDLCVVGGSATGAFAAIAAARLSAIDEDGAVKAVVIEDKTGRRAIRARMLVDASGDADLAHRAGFECWRGRSPSPAHLLRAVQRDGRAGRKSAEGGAGYRV